MRSTMRYRPRRHLRVADYTPPVNTPRPLDVAKAVTWVLLVASSVLAWAAFCRYVLIPLVDLT